METGELKQTLYDIKEDVGEIKAQVKLTNGRVSSLENEKFFIRGGLAVLTILVVPIVLYAATKLMA